MTPICTLPPFTPDGVLPPGDYQITLSDLRTSMLVMGPENRAQTWDTKQRLFLVDQLSILAGQLWRVGISNIFIDGSFVEEKDHPNDIDGYFVCDFDQLISGNLERHLNQLDPYKVWTWDPHSRKPYRGYPKKQLPMWHRYRVELYPHYGQSSGIRDKWGKELEFPSAFRQSRRDGTQKGILQIIRDSGDLP